MKYINTFIISILISFSGCSDPEIMDSVVIEKYYTPSSVGIGNSVSADGKSSMGTIIIPESASILVNENGEAVSIPINKSQYVNINKGSRVKYWKKWHGRYIIDNK